MFYIYKQISINFFTFSLYYITEMAKNGFFLFYERPAKILKTMPRIACKIGATLEGKNFFKSRRYGKEQITLC